VVTLPTRHSSRLERIDISSISGPPMKTSSCRRSPQVGVQCFCMSALKRSVCGHRSFGTAAHQRPRPSVRVTRPAIDISPIHAGWVESQKCPLARMTPLGFAARKALNASGANGRFAR
jgi:hypothetical protein